MRFRASFKTVIIMVASLFFAANAHAGEEVGKVCVQTISKGASWKANDTGASEKSIFTVQIDDFIAIRVSTNATGVFTNLSLNTKHFAKILLDGKPLTSFQFTFQERGDHLRLWYSPFYGTWSLSDVRAGEKCACPKQLQSSGISSGSR